MISLLVNILILCIVLALFYWILSVIPLPPVAKQIANVAMVVIFVIYIVYLLLPLAGGTYHFPR